MFDLQIYGPHFLTPLLPYSLTPLLPYSLTPLLPYSLTPLTSHPAKRAVRRSSSQAAVQHWHR
ncbi:hypothetical protein FGI60_23320 [Brucella haematophila]|nr:hypothetical protein FGI60_23320 [Brucella haematophila]